MFYTASKFSPTAALEHMNQCDEFAAFTISFGAISEQRQVESESYVPRRGRRRGTQVTPLYCT